MADRDERTGEPFATPLDDYAMAQQVEYAREQLKNANRNYDDAKSMGGLVASWHRSVLRWNATVEKLRAELAGRAPIGGDRDG